ncbi:MAG: hypothetical protein ACRERX_08630 [Pseudomonas sp.]
MDEFDYWMIGDEFSVTHAAALIVGVSPARLCCHQGIHYLSVGLNDTSTSTDDPKFQAAFAAIKKAIKGCTLKAKVRVSAREYGEADAQLDAEYNECLYESGRGRTAEEGEILAEDFSCFYKPFPDWELTTLGKDDLRAWLASRGITRGFFFPAREESQAGYLNRSHPNYAPKLAAAIHAWEAVNNNPELLRGKSPKTAIKKWLKEHAGAYGLIKTDGTPNTQGIDETAKLANWKPEGGASKTSKK